MSGRGIVANINLKQIEAFVSVADLSSFRRAAERLNTTQPNVSARIRSLEEQIGQRLFTRDAGSVRLTGPGRRLLVKAREVLAAQDRFLSAVGDDQIFDGTLRLGVTEMVAHSWLGRFLAALSDRFPNVDLKLTVDISNSISAALFDRTIDLALQSGPFDRPCSGNVALGDFPLIWVAAPALEYGDGEVTIEDLTRRPILTHANRTLPYEQLRAHLDEQATGPVRLVPSTHLAACLQMALDGIGIACLPRAMVRAALNTRALEQLSYAWVPDPLRFVARFEGEVAPGFVAEAAQLAAEVCETEGDNKS